MSLVAYDASSDEDSECEQNEETTSTKLKVPAALTQNAATNGHISDDDDEDYQAAPVDRKTNSLGFSLLLHKPKHESTIAQLLQDIPAASIKTLPTPKQVVANVEEEDDEFLHKRDNFEVTEIKPPPKVAAKGPVKINIPSLKEFRDVSRDMGNKPKPLDGPCKALKGSGLLSMLPQAKSERNFSKAENPVPGKETASTKTAPAFIPDTVKYRRPAHITEEFGAKHVPTKSRTTKVKPKLVACSDSEGSDEESASTNPGKDFFSFNTDNSLPEVSANEINVLVAKKAARMAEVTDKYLAAEVEKKNAQETEETRSNLQELELARKRYHEQQLDSDAVQALVGSSAKRRRNQKDPINIVDLNSADVLPNKDEWLRTALASSTVYQPTGVLVDEEPAAGTRRKHQITYLAHKAKANEAELQAMWAANRQNRRATQSKYGF